MRSALYYPHTEIRNENLLKSALFLWDKVHVIVPWPQYTPRYEAKRAQEAFALVGVCHYPTEEEKRKAHEFIEDFATRPLPKPFNYSAPKGDRDIYEIYSQKLLHNTRRLLKDSGLIGEQLANADMPATQATGLTLMSILADCCAGETLARITDRGSAYATLSGLLVEDDGNKQRGISATCEQLLQVTLKIANVEALPLDKLIDLRKREDGARDGHDIRQLRHKFRERLETQAKLLAGAKTQTDCSELSRQFEDDMKDDFRSLREALKLEAFQTIGTKEILGSIVAGISAATAVTLGAPFHTPEALVGSAAALTTVGILTTASKYARTRQKILSDHPMAYLYDASGAWL
jgi:hypothetical protein